jgi:hypothetical protein
MKNTPFKNFIALLCLLIALGSYSNPTGAVVLLRFNIPMHIDSIKIFAFESYPNKYVVRDYDYKTPLDSTSEMVIFYAGQKLCLPITEEDLWCQDTLVIKLDGDPYPCKKKIRIIGSYLSCRPPGHSRVHGFYGTGDFPCDCNKKKFRRRY